MAATHTPGTDYGVDAPAVMRNLFLIAGVCLLCAFALPREVPIWPFTPRITIATLPFFLLPGTFFLVEAFLFLLYVKLGKFRHRDFMLAMHTWRGDEQVLDIGCGRGLLLAGAAKHLISGTPRE